MAKRRSVAARVLASYVLVLMAFAMTALFSVDSERRAAREAELLRTGYVPLKFSIQTAHEAQNIVGDKLNHITEAGNPADARIWIETERRARPKMFLEIRSAAHGLGTLERKGRARPADRRSSKRPPKSSSICRRTARSSRGSSTRSEWAIRKKRKACKMSSSPTKS